MGCSTLCRPVLLTSFELVHLLLVPSGVASLLRTTAQGPSFFPHVHLSAGKIGDRPSSLTAPPPPSGEGTLQRTTSKSHIGELAPMALCDIHIAGCGEHLPAWGLRDAYRALIRPSGEDAMGRSCILDSHPGRWMPVAVRMPAVVRMPACYSRRFKGERPIGAATG